MRQIFSEIQIERLRQDLKFGGQPRNLRPVVYLAVLCEELGEVARAIIEGDSENYREELIQLASVAVASVQEFDGGLPIHQIESVCVPIAYRKSNRDNKKAGTIAHLELF